MSQQGAATQIFSQRFDQRFFSLPISLQRRVQEKIDAVGIRLRTFPHYRMEGVDTFRLRIGDYRIIYQISIANNELYLVAIGHRRDIFK